MGLIIKDKLQKFMVGYPTVSDKYNVAGGILAGDTSVKFGDLVKYGDTTGYYEAITSTVTVADIAGFVLATNVKLATTYPAASEDVETLPGEAFNLVLPGSYLAIKLDDAAVEADVKANAEVKVLLATGKCTTSSITTGTATLTGVTFTGEYELQSGVIVAEVYVK